MMRYWHLACILALYGLRSCITSTMKSTIAPKGMCTCERSVLNHRLSMKDSMYNQSFSKTIWVFKTSVTMSSDIKRLKTLLDKLMHEGDKWNFDLEDCDHILRVETQTLSATVIIQQLEKVGYKCAALEDDNDFSELTLYDFISNSPPVPF